MGQGDVFGYISETLFQVPTHTLAAKQTGLATQIVLEFFLFQQEVVEVTTHPLQFDVEGFLAPPEELAPGTTLVDDGLPIGHVV